MGAHTQSLKRELAQTQQLLESKEAQVVNLKETLRHSEKLCCDLQSKLKEKQYAFEQATSLLEESNYKLEQLEETLQVEREAFEIEKTKIVMEILHQKYSQPNSKISIPTTHRTPKP